MGIMSLFLQKIARLREKEAEQGEAFYEEQVTRSVNDFVNVLQLTLKKTAEEFASRDGAKIFHSDLAALAEESNPDVKDVEELTQKIHNEIKRIQSIISLHAGKVQKAEGIRTGLKLLEDIETGLKSIYPFEEEVLDKDTIKESKTVKDLDILLTNLSALIENKEVSERYSELEGQIKEIFASAQKLVQSFEDVTPEESIEELKQNATEVFSSFQELLPLVSSCIEEFIAAVQRENEEVLNEEEQGEQFKEYKNELIQLIVLNERLNSCIHSVKDNNQS